MFPNNCVSFIANNVKGMQSYKKRLKLMQYFKDKIGSKGVLLLQETHSESKSSKNGKKILKVQFVFPRKVKFLWRLNCLF